jgi:hypothetical protein
LKFIEEIKFGEQNKNLNSPEKKHSTDQQNPAPSFPERTVSQNPKPEQQRQRHHERDRNVLMQPDQKRFDYRSDGRRVLWSELEKNNQPEQKPCCDKCRHENARERVTRFFFRGGFWVNGIRHGQKSICPFPGR